MKLYFKQAWQLLKQNRIYSLIYILGTGLSISMIMILSIVFYIRIANIYPETGRDRLLILQYGEYIMDGGGRNTSRLSLEVMKACIYSLKTAEAVTAVYNGWGEYFVQPDNSDEQIPVTVKHVDTGFWEVFSFSFLQGKPFTEADMQSGIKTLVISESFAREVFETTADITGQYISLNFDQYRICGVVKDPSFVANKSFSQVWIPYTNNPDVYESWANSPPLGNFSGYVLAPSIKEVDKVKTEIQENLQKYTVSLDNPQFSVKGEPDRQWQSIFRFYGGQTIDFTKLIIQYVFIFLLFLLIPAISLSGMADSQMERRLDEMGVRRAFGASRGTLMGQLISENLLFTLSGGIAGLLFSYILIYYFRTWIIHIGIKQVFQEAVPLGLDVSFSPSMLMNFTVFFIALGVCVILNLLVTLIPAWRASNREIVYSINIK